MLECASFLFPKGDGTYDVDLEMTGDYLNRFVEQSSVSSPEEF